MKKNKIGICWVLLFALIFLFTAVLSTGSARARYKNTVTTAAIMQTSIKSITSNCLVTAEEPSRTVLLGDIEKGETIAVPFWLLSSAEEQTLKLNWGVADSAHTGYLDVAVKHGGETLSADQEIQLEKDVKLELELCLVPTALAFETDHEETKINVQVTLGDTMQGTFLVTLPEVEISAEENSPEEITTENEITVAEEAATSTEIMALAEIDETTEFTETTESTEFTETTEPMETTEFIETTETTETTETIVPDPEEETTETTETTETETTETETTESDKTDTETEFVDTQSELKTIQAFDITQQLPVVMTLADSITSARLGLRKDSEGTASEENVPEEILLEALPDYTMYSVDDGANYNMVYGDVIPEFTLGENKKVSLLLDFGYTNLEQNVQLTLAMETYLGNQLKKTCTVDTVANVDCESVLFGEEDTEEQNVSEHILNFENKLEFTLPVEWKETELGYSAEILTMTDSQTLQYVPVKLSDNKLSDNKLQATYLDEEETHRLELRLGQKFTQPGTYRINIFWEYEDLRYYTIQKTVFINCLGRE